MRAVVSSRSERNRPDLPLLTVARERGVFVRRDDDENHNAIPDDLSNYKVARAGDLVVNKMKAWQGSLGLAPVDGIVSPAYYVFDFDIADRAFGQYLLRSKPYVALMAAASDGVRIGQWDLVMQRFRELPVLVPPAEEQAAIVKYLGHAHARIDRAIAAKRKLIALLEEQRRVVVISVLREGLDPTALTVDTGVPWLGEIPAHWELRKLGQVARIRTGGRDTADRVDGGEFPFYVRSQIVEGIDTYSFDGEGVLTAGDGAGVGKVFHYVDGKFDFHQRVYLFSDFREVSGRYFFEYLRAYLKFETDYGTAKSTVDSLRRPMLKNLPVAVPPATEQARILERIRSAAESVEWAADRTRREIELLREFRTRLTADVVTGQVDVRAVAATLPDLPADQAFDVGGDDENDSHDEELLDATGEDE